MVILVNTVLAFAVGGVSKRSYEADGLDVSNILQFRLDLRDPLSDPGMRCASVIDKLLVEPSYQIMSLHSKAEYQTFGPMRIVNGNMKNTWPRMA